jgi:hypothetical protein
MTSENITKEELANLLMEKHRNYTKEYKKEYDALERISVLKEKQEQIQYWVKDSKDNPAQNQKYQAIAKATEKEMSTLQQDLRSLYESKAGRNYGPSESDPKARHTWLKTQIKLQEEAGTYWEGKKKEIAEQPSGAKPEEKTEMHEPLKKIKRVKKAKKSSKASKNPRKKDTQELKDEGAL